MNGFIPSNFVEASPEAFTKWLNNQNRSWRRDGFASGMKYIWVDSGKMFAFAHDSGKLFCDPDL